MLAVIVIVLDHPRDILKNSDQKGGYRNTAGEHQPLKGRWKNTEESNQ